MAVKRAKCSTIGQVVDQLKKEFGGDSQGVLILEMALEEILQSRVSYRPKFSPSADPVSLSAVPAYRELIKEERRLIAVMKQICEEASNA